MDGFDLVRAKRYALVVLIKTLALYCFLLVLCYYALGRVYESMGGSHDAGLLLASLGYLLPFMVLPLIAFIAGGFAPGDRRRMALRCLMAVMIAALLMRPEGFGYSISDIILDPTTGTYADGVRLEMSIDGFRFVLMAVPVLMIADALLEMRYPSTTRGWLSGNVKSPESRGDVRHSFMIHGGMEGNECASIPPLAKDPRLW